MAIAVLASIRQDAHAQVILSNNLSNATTGTEAATGNRWLTSSFGTGTSAYTLSSVTLLLANSTSGTARLDLYSDGGLEPGSLISTLTPPASFPTTLGNATWTSNGVTLSLNTTYWVVLRANSGQFDWAWTSN